MSVNNKKNKNKKDFPWKYLEYNNTHLLTISAYSLYSITIYTKIDTTKQKQNDYKKKRRDTKKKKMQKQKTTKNKKKTK